MGKSQSLGIIFAFMAGLCAASSALAAKLAGEDFELVVRAIFGVLYLVGNIGMWYFFSKSLDLVSSTLIALVINSMTNFVFSGFFGWAFFGDLLGSRWLLGIVMIAIGVGFIYKGETVIHKPDTEQKTTQKKED